MEIPSKEDLLTTTLSDIQENTNIKNTGIGSVVRLITESIINQIKNLYDYIQNIYNKTTLSLSSGSDLDIKGELTNCQRNSVDETDTNYRARIAKQPQVLARENLTDLEMSLLLIDGIKRVYIDEYNCGGGSFTTYILTDEINIPSNILYKAQQIVSTHKATGIIGNISAPKSEYCYISFILKQNTSSLSSTALIDLIKDYVKNYIEEYIFGDTIDFEALANDVAETYNFSDCKINYITINDNYIYNYSFYQVGQYSRLIFDGIGVEVIE